MTAMEKAIEAGARAIYEADVHEFDITGSEAIGYNPEIMNDRSAVEEHRRIRVVCDEMARAAIKAALPILAEELVTVISQYPKVTEPNTPLNNVLREMDNKDRVFWAHLVRARFYQMMKEDHDPLSTSPAVHAP